MSARYGSRTRSGDAISDLGRRAEAGGGGVQQVAEERFTSPGTWTWPGTVSYVQVTVVGGGGGGGGGRDNVAVAGGGGGGRVRTEIWPVSGPVPITVGAGGTGGLRAAPGTTQNGLQGADGGTSAFGPLGPGPIPLIPATTVAAGGGGGGGGNVTGTSPNPGTPYPDSMGRDAPPIGGGGGGSGIIYYPSPSGSLPATPRFGGKGAFGGNGAARVNNLQPPYIAGAGGGGGASEPARHLSGGRGIDGMGGGAMGGLDSPFGFRWDDWWGYGVDGGGTAYVGNSLTPGLPNGPAPGQANTGGGGAGGQQSFPAPLNPGQGGNGGSGIVIVRYFA